jgi:hypothetical protein
MIFCRFFSLRMEGTINRVNKGSFYLNIIEFLLGKFGRLYSPNICFSLQFIDLQIKMRNKSFSLLHKIFLFFHIFLAYLEFHVYQADTL